MFINSITAPTQVWNAATRTLTADPATDAGASTLVWTHAARTLTTEVTTGMINDEGTAVALTVTTSAVQGTLGSYVQVVASSAHTVLEAIVEFQGVTTGNDYTFVIATGGAGSEVVKRTVGVRWITATLLTYKLSLDPSLIPKGVRVAVAAANQTAGAAEGCKMHVRLVEKND